MNVGFQWSRNLEKITGSEQGASKLMLIGKLLMLNQFFFTLYNIYSPLIFKDFFFHFKRTQTYQMLCYTKLYCTTNFFSIMLICC